MPLWVLQENISFLVPNFVDIEPGLLELFENEQGSVFFEAVFV